MWGTSNKNIQSVYRNGFWQWKMCHVHYEEREKTNSGRNRTSKLRKNQNACRREKLQVLGNIGSEHYQTSRNEGKNTKRIP